MANEEAKNAAGGFWCQNCSKVEVEKQGDFCPACRELTGIKRTIEVPPDPQLSEAYIVADILRRAGIIEDTDQARSETMITLFKFMRANGLHITVKQEK